MKLNQKLVTGLILSSIVATTSPALAADQDLSRLKGSIRIDGSSTVYPITEAISESFAEVAPRVRVTVGISGTGGGMKRFTISETDISDASRPIKKKELAKATSNGVSFIEVPVAYDGLSIVVNPANYWVKQLTVDDLKRIFLADSPAKRWNQVRPEWPDVAIKVYAPGTDSGTFDYFKEVVAGKKGAIRGDMSVSEDDNVLVMGVAGDEGAIGFFGCAYYFENQDKLKVVPIVNPKLKHAVTPTTKTIASGEYAPFSRPLFIYVNVESLKRKEVTTFVDFYLENAAVMAEEVGYVRLPEKLYQRAVRNLASHRLGTQFLDTKGNKIHGSLEDIYR